MIKCYLSVLYKREKSEVLSLAKQIAKTLEKRDIELVKLMDPFTVRIPEMMKICINLNDIEFKKFLL